MYLYISYNTNWILEHKNKKNLKAVKNCLYRIIYKEYLKFCNYDKHEIFLKK